MANRAKIKKILYYLLLTVVLIGSIYALLRLSPALVTSGNLASDDFVQFWASGNLNIQGLNPFEPNSIQQIRSSLGGSATPQITAITLYPPWVIPFLMISGSLSYPVSRVLWLLLSVAIILFSSLLLWSIYEGDKKRRWLYIPAVLIYSPTISLLEKGQFTCVMLLGLAGFLYFVTIKRNDWLAGTCLALVTVKPQLVLLFWLVILIWSFQQKRWKIWLSTAVTVILLTLIAWLYNPSIIRQYVDMLKSYGLSEWATPTIGAYFRYFWIGTNQFWIQFLPTIIAGIWLVYHVSKVQHAWIWKDILPVALFTSIVSSPYAWTYDQVILIPAVIQAVIWLVAVRKYWITIIFTLAYLAINLLNLLLHMRLDDFWFIWFAPVVWIWYLLVQHQSRLSQRELQLSRQMIG